MTMSHSDTICAISSASGQGAIAIIRLSGMDALGICEMVFKPKKKDLVLSEQQGGTLHYGTISDHDQIIDDVLVGIFKAPHSYSGEDIIEISCHGSVYIQQRILKLLLQHGARLAGPGEFTLRAFINGKMDLSQAEAVSDLINSQTETSHRMAIDQMRGGFSHKLKELRQKLLNFTSLIELELDFSEEDVEFADRTEFKKLLDEIEKEITRLRSSFELGNAIKNGIPITIAGNPNVGKSTLLNTILNEEKAIVSDIAGTTRDSIEDVLNIKGIAFRFIDTAGIRETTDAIESIGINRTFEKMKQARIILFLVDAGEKTEIIQKQIQSVNPEKHQKLFVLLNKSDKLNKEELKKIIDSLKSWNVVPICAKDPAIVEEFLIQLHDSVEKEINEYDNTLVSTMRHAEALEQTLNSLQHVKNGLEEQISTDLLAIDIRGALHFLGEITGEINTDEILGNIFRNFCIGK